MRSLPCSRTYSAPYAHGSISQGGLGFRADRRRIQSSALPSSRHESVGRFRGQHLRQLRPTNNRWSRKDLPCTEESSPIYNRCFSPRREGLQREPSLFRDGQYACPQNEPASRPCSHRRLSRVPAARRLPRAPVGTNRCRRFLPAL